MWWGTSIEKQKLEIIQSSTSELWIPLTYIQLIVVCECQCFHNSCRQATTGMAVRQVGVPMQAGKPCPNLLTLSAAAAHTFIWDSGAFCVSPLLSVPLSTCVSVHQFLTVWTKVLPLKQQIWRSQCFTPVCPALWRYVCSRTCFILLFVAFTCSLRTKLGLSVYCGSKEHA